MATTRKRWNGKPREWGAYRDIPWSKYVLAARERHMRDLEKAIDPDFPYYYDDKAADKAVWFIEQLKHYDGEWKGKPFILSDWQEYDIVRPLFGWKRKSNGFRRFRSAYVEVARKNGKSQLAAAIALYLMFGDKEAGAQIYAAATKEEQARIVWEMAGKMLQTSPFESHIEAFKSSYYNPALGSVFKPLGRDSKTQDGFSVHGAIIDEYHAHKTSALLDVLSSGRGARRQPLILVITTAGHENGGPCKAESNRMKKLLLNELESDEIFAFIATVDNEENWREESEWIKANPNWGISVYVEGFRSSFKECDQSTSKTNEFQVKNLNIWKENVSRWIKASSYDACPQVPLDLESLKGKRCFGGLDMGVTQDLSALTLAFYLKEPEKEEELPDVALLNFYWIPESSVRERWLNDGVRYPDWVADGWVRTTEGDTTRHDIIRRDINELSQMYEIAELAIDKMHAHQLMVQLEDDGLIIVKHSQSLMGMSFPAKTFEELILSKKLHVGGDPVFRWQVLNTVIITDGNGNIKPMKNKSEEKIDGVVAACMAVGRLVIAPEPQNFIYNERKGIFFG